MALMRKFKVEKNYVEIPNETARAVETKTKEITISLQALGLITNLWSYNVEEWELHKLELYKRFDKNKKTSVMSAWADLLEADYIMEFKVRIGKENDYVYYYRITPFSAEEKKEIEAIIIDEYGNFSGSGFENLKMRSSFSASQNQHLLKTKEKKDFKKEIKTKEINTRLPSLVDMDSSDLILKKIFPEAPLAEIRAKLLEDAKTGNPLIDTKNRYEGIMRHRLNDWLRSKRTETAQIRPKRIVRTEHTPEWFQEPEEYYAEPKEDDNVKKVLIGIKLKLIRGVELTEEENMLWEIENQG